MTSNIDELRKLAEAADLTDIPGQVRSLLNHADERRRNGWLKSANNLTAAAGIILSQADEIARLRKALEELEQRGTSLIKAIDKFNTDTNSDLAGGVIFQFCGAVGDARAALSPPHADREVQND